MSAAPGVDQALAGAMTTRGGVVPSERAEISSISANVVDDLRSADDIGSSTRATPEAFTSGHLRRERSERSRRRSQPPTST